MRSPLTDQARSIAVVAIKGEMSTLKGVANSTVENSMVAQLSTLANEASQVSLEVGTEGILGGQAFVPDVQGMWKVRHIFLTLILF
jgi:hypothetical protein